MTGQGEGTEMDPFADEAPRKGSAFDIKWLWRAFWRRRLLFAVPFLLCLTMAGVTIKIMTPVYFSVGQILIKYSEVQSQFFDAESRSYRRSRQQEASTRAEIDILVTSPKFLAKVIDEFKLDEAIQEAARAAGNRVPSREAARRIADSRLRQMIRVGIDGRDLYWIGVVDPNPQHSLELTKYIIDLFILEFRASRQKGQSETRDFLEEQRLRYQGELDTAEEALTAFLATLASETLSDNPINASNLATGQLQLDLLRERFYGQDTNELAELESGARRVVGALPALEPYAQDVVVTRILRELEDLGISMLLTPSGDRHASELQNTSGQLRVRLNSRIEDQVAKNYPNLGLMDRNRLSQYIYFSLFRSTEQKVMNRVTRNVREFRDFAARQPAQSARLQELQDDVARFKQLVQSIEDEITQHTLNIEAAGSDVVYRVEIRREPTLPRAPSEPNKMKLAFMGFVLSFVLGMGLVVLSIFLDRSFNSVDEIERALGLPVIGTLPVIRDEHFERKRELRILRWVTIVLGILAVAAVGFLVIYPRLA